eukprot:scaffold31670_cov17-Tisochrysis_lutea.AAC.1
MPFESRSEGGEPEEGRLAGTLRSACLLRGPVRCPCGRGAAPPSESRGAAEPAVRAADATAEQRSQSSEQPMPPPAAGPLAPAPPRRLETPGAAGRARPAPRRQLPRGKGGAAR